MTQNSLNQSAKGDCVIEEWSEGIWTSERTQNLSKSKYKMYAVDLELEKHWF